MTSCAHWTDEELAFYFARDGYVAPVRISDPQMAQAALGAPTADHPDPDTALWARLEPSLRAALANAVAAVVGAPPRCIAAACLCDETIPRRSREWHQDSEYFPDCDPGILVAVWLALSEITSTNGAVRVVPGSHRAGPLPPQRIRAPDRARYARVLELRPGEITLQHGCAIHRAPPNRSTVPRKCLWFAFVAGAHGRSGSEASVVRGCAGEGGLADLRESGP